MTSIEDLTRPSEVQAPRDYIHQVARDLGLDDNDTAERVADYIAGETERVGGSGARLVFLVGGDGSGPYCSWCWALSGICPHIAGGASEYASNTTA